MMTERFGYESMKTLWSPGPRPDGLFIFSHSAVRGSLTALLEIGVNIPEELKLVAHGNIEREKGRRGGGFLNEKEIEKTAYSSSPITNHK